MTFDWHVYECNYKKRLKNLTTSAKGVVKSDKFFPVFLEDNKEKVFKPLSKTKPLSTPYFAYSEVYWSTIINKYFDQNAPVYKLAICKNIEEEFENKYHHGTIVDSLESPEEKLVNLYEIFQSSPDPNVNISDYINYCEQFYDYTSIFDSKLIKENQDLANDLAKQILLSLLRLDQNYHYENILFNQKDDTIISLAPPIDHEFSSMFLYLDSPQRHLSCINNAVQNLTMPEELIEALAIKNKTLSQEVIEKIAIAKYKQFATLSLNLDKIILQCRDTSIEFLENLKHFINDLKQEPIVLEDHGYLVPFSSDNYLIGHARYKKNNQLEAERLKNIIPQHNPDINVVNNMVNEETLLTSQVLETEIEKRLIKKECKGVT